LVSAIFAWETFQVEMGYVSDYEAMIKPLMEAVPRVGWFDGLNPQYN